ncbi:hypothetical protein PG996_006846 [Apiospora saccharicola]|uniref:Fungal N-terminal domain-containing protein n=1 Tax=Apiospora saccharicola TaxID=335842 RepID=A0ABR1V955_9PEZI
MSVHDFRSQPADLRQTAPVEAKSNPALEPYHRHGPRSLSVLRDLMADPLSVAGLAAGLVSLGLQLTGGITNYLDAVKCRGKELASARGHNDSLRQTIAVLEATVAKTQIPQPASFQIVDHALKPTKTQLKALEDLVDDLAGCDTGTWKSKLSNKSRKLWYAFDRSKIQQLATQLSQANMTLSIALQVLGVDVSQSNFDKLTGIETISHGISSNLNGVSSDLLATRSEVASLHHPLSQMGDRFSTLERGIDQLNHAITTGNHSITTQLLQTTQHTHNLVSVSSHREHNTLEQIVAQNNHMMQLLEGIARGSDIPGAIEMRQPQTQKRIVHRLMEKPSATRVVLDGFHGASISPPNSWTAPGNACSELQPRDLSNGLTCICNTRHISISRRAVRTGAFIWQSESASHEHWPSCPLAHSVGDEHKQTFGLGYTGLAKVFKTAVEISFSMSYRAGGLSLSPTINFRPAVDRNSDPAFRILFLVFSVIRFTRFGSLTESELSTFLLESQTGILESFKESKSTPFATDSDNGNILHFLAKIMDFFHRYDKMPFKAFFRFFKTLHVAGVPTDTYTLDGVTPLGTLISRAGPSCLLEYKNLVLGSDIERHPFWIGDRDLNRSTDTVRETMVLFYEVPAMSEYYGFGPLSNAILSNNLVKVSHLLDRFPDSLQERNILGQTPLHIAVGKPKCLSLLVNAAAGSSNILDAVDNAGHTPLDMAMLITKHDIKIPGSLQLYTGTERLKFHWAHSLFEETGYDLGNELDSDIKGNLRLNSVEAIRELNTQFFNLNIADDCRCKCSIDGCTLQIHQLSGLTLPIYNRSGLDSTVFLSRQVSKYYELLAMSIPYGSHHNAIRFLTFTALGATHTCCKEDRWQFRFERDPEEIACVQEEDRHLLEILEGLVAEFDQKFYAILGTQPDNHEQLAKFWTVHWLPRMQEVLEELNTTDLPEDVKRKTEEMGVVWHGPERVPVPEATVDRGSWDYWFGELDKIVGKK